MYYSDQIIDEVRSRNDIVDVVGSYVKLKRSGSGYQGLCPFHSEKTPSFHVNPSRQTYKCFGCGKGGNVFTFLMEYENFSFPEALRYLAERSGVELPKEDVSKQQQKRAEERSRLQAVYKEAATYYYQRLRSPAGQNAYRYLLERGLSEETIIRFGLGYSDSKLYPLLKKEGYSDEFLSKSGLFTYTEERGVRDKFWNRVMFPIMDANSKVIAFGGRVMGDGMPKYLNSPETEIFEKSRHLYGLHVARRTKRPYMLLCEGYMDTIALHQAGFDNAVASLGTALTGLQANLLRRYTKEVAITYDSDGAGQKAALRAIPILREAGIKTRVVNLRPYKDPDEFVKALGARAYEERVEQAESSFFFELRVLSEEFDRNDPEDKMRFYQEAAKKMLLFPDELERNTYIQAFCKEYYVPVDEFRKLVNRLGSQSSFQKNYEEVRAKDRKEFSQRSKPENGLRTAQKLLLTWCVEQPEYFSLLDGILAPEDFEEGIFQSVAEKCFLQYQEAGRVDPAQLISRFETKEEQTLAADICSARLYDELKPEERRKAFADTVIRIKSRSLELAGAKAVQENDANRLLTLMKEKKELSALHKRLLG